MGGHAAGAAAPTPAFGGRDPCHAQEPSGPALLGVLRSHEALTAAGFSPPSGEDLLGNQAPPSLTEQLGHLPEPSARGPVFPGRAFQQPPFHQCAVQPRAHVLFLPTCVPCCCGFCASLCLCPSAPAGVVALSTLLASTEQPALGLVLCGVVDARSMTAASRSLQTACPCGMERGLQSTRPLCRHSQAVVWPFLARPCPAHCLAGGPQLHAASSPGGRSEEFRRSPPAAAGPAQLVTALRDDALGDRRPLAQTSSTACLCCRRPRRARRG